VRKTGSTFLAISLFPALSPVSPCHCGPRPAAKKSEQTAQEPKDERDGVQAQPLASRINETRYVVRVLFLDTQA